MKRSDGVSFHPIPAMTDPMGQNWSQPNRFDIEVDGTHALMSDAAFRRLPEYSGTIPTGVYPGKMWRRHDGVYDPRCPVEKRRWLLCWYGEDNGGRCAIEFREVLLV